MQLFEGCQKTIMWHRPEVFGASSMTYFVTSLRFFYVMCYNFFTLQYMYSEVAEPLHFKVQRNTVNVASYLLTNCENFSFR
jgi:hypothetical protein